MFNSLVVSGVLQVPRIVFLCIMAVHVRLCNCVLNLISSVCGRDGPAKLFTVIMANVSTLFQGFPSRTKRAIEK